MGNPDPDKVQELASLQPTQRDARKVLALERIADALEKIESSDRHRRLAEDKLVALREQRTGRRAIPPLPFR